MRKSPRQVVSRTSRPSKQLLTTEEVARLLGVSRVSVHRWLQAKKMKYSKTPGGHRRIERDELRRFVEEAGRDIPPELAPAAASAAPTGASPARSHAPARLLLVDDDKNIVDAMKRVLEVHAHGRYTVSVAEDGFSALLRAIDELPDAIVMDGILLGLDGVRACRTLKANAKTKHIAVVAISGNPGLEEEFRRAGADAFLLKPFESKTLVELLEALQVVPAKKAAG